MKTKILSAILAVSFLLGAPALSHAANANQCKDAKGKFIKCPPTAAASATPAAATAKTTCRDAKGKFIKCSTTPTTPKQCRDAKGKFTKCPA